LCKDYFLHRTQVENYAYLCGGLLETKQMEKQKKTLSLVRVGKTSQFIWFVSTRPNTRCFDTVLPFAIISAEKKTEVSMKIQSQFKRVSHALNNDRQSWLNGRLKAVAEGLVL